MASSILRSGQAKAKRQESSTQVPLGKELPSLQGRIYPWGYIWIVLYFFLYLFSIFLNYHLTPISKSCIWVSVFDHQGRSLDCLVNPSISISSDVAILNNIDDFAEPALSSAHLDFKDKLGSTYMGGLLIHYLLANGRGDEVLQRRKELSPSLLAKTCKYSYSTYWAMSGVRRDHETYSVMCRCKKRRGGQGLTISQVK